MKVVNAAICIVAAGLLSGCVDGPGYRSISTPTSVTCGNGQDDVSHPYAGRCDWRRMNGRDWANSGSGDNAVYPRGR